MKQTRLLLLLTASLLCLQTLHAQNTSPYWSLAGNSTATTSSKLGTTTAVPLRLVTNNLERLRIDAAGKVGIGLTVPKGKLSVLNNGGVPAAVWVSSNGTSLFTGFGEGSSGSGDHILEVASGSAIVRPVLIGRRSRGTLAAPATVLNNDVLNTLLGSGYDGSAFQNGLPSIFR